MKLQILPLEKWKELAENCHRLAFKEERPLDLITCDYAILVTSNDDKIMGFATIIELTKKSAYMQHGATMPETQGTANTARLYHLVLAYLKDNYDRLTTRILNTNRSMLKLSLSADLIVHGIDCIGGETFLNLMWER